MMKNKYLIIVLVLVLFNGCGGGINDYSEELSGGYLYRVDGGARYILPNIVFQKGVYPSVVNYAYNKDFILIQQKPSRNQIKIFLAHDLITKYHFASNIKDSVNEDRKLYDLWDNHFYQDSMLINLIVNKFSLVDYENIIPKSHEIAEEIMDTSYFFNKMLSEKNAYWIISHIEEKEYGPFSSTEFLVKVKDLTVSDKLLEEFTKGIIE